MAERLTMQDAFQRAIQDELCNLVANDARPLKNILAERPDLPSQSSITIWLQRNPEFREQWREAKARQAQLLIDDIAGIADDPANLEGAEYLNWSKLRIDTRKWLAARLLPGLYGDKIQNEHKITVTHEDALKQLE